MSTELILFTSGDVALSVPITPEENTVWLSQAQMVELYGRDVSVISRHINNVFKEGEVEKESNLHFLQITGSDRPTGIGREKHVQCPYCGKEMQKGILSGDGRSNVCWKAGENKTGFMDSFFGTGKLTAVKHTLASFSIETYFCDQCKKMIFDTDIQT